MIVREDIRREKLLAHGVPSRFLDAVDGASSHEVFEFIFKYPESGYFYLNTIQNYTILQGYDVTPIYDSLNGDSFWMLLSNSDGARFVHFELEQDEIYDDYGSEFMRMLADLVIFLYESEDELSIAEVARLSEELGFENAEVFLRALENADEKGLRRSFESDRMWRNQNIHHYI